MLAVTEDRELFQQAWSRNVMLVSPSTLLFVLRTVAHLWRQDAQNRNALEIAKRGSELYDKLVGFVESLDSIGNRLSQAQRDFDTAKSRLTGKGGAVRQAEMLRELGVKPGKAMPAALLALPEEDGPEGVG
jgi:DNA recombination protein RmuC